MGIKSLLFIWQDEKTSLYFHVGTLTYDGDLYKFEYTHHSKANRKVYDAMEHGYTLHPTFPKLKKKYESKKMFPAFARRIPSKNRIDYEKVLENLSLPNNADEMDILQATRGIAGKSPYSFDEPLQLNDGNILSNYFYINGMRHIELPDNWHNLIQIGNELILKSEPNNPVDSNAVKVITQENVHLGYVPGVYSKAIKALIKRGIETKIMVKEINLNHTPQNWVKVRFQSILNKEESTTTIIELDGLIAPAA